MPRLVPPPVIVGGQLVVLQDGGDGGVRLVLLIQVVTPVPQLEVAPAPIISCHGND